MQVGSNRFISSSFCPCWQPWLVLLRERLLGRERQILCWCSTVQRGRISGWSGKKGKANKYSLHIKIHLETTFNHVVWSLNRYLWSAEVLPHTMWWHRHGVPDQRQTGTGTGTTELQVERMINTSEEQSLNYILNHWYFGVNPDKVLTVCKMMH